jgi:phosphatidate cytidylyltransferase
MTKPFGINDIQPKILISIFVLIWTNDSFAYIVGKSIGKTKLFERISPKKTIEGFIGGVVFCVIASYLISKYYIQIAVNFIWIIIAVIVGVLEPSVILNQNSNVLQVLKTAENNARPWWRARSTR